MLVGKVDYFSSISWLCGPTWIGLTASQAFIIVEQVKSDKVKFLNIFTFHPLGKLQKNSVISGQTTKGPNLIPAIIG